MKEIEVKNNQDTDDFAVVDWKDTEGLLECIDSLLNEHGLELIQGNDGSDCYLLKIDKIEG